jgi:ribosomal protein S18 acetylase RimI-like enzyme
MTADHERRAEGSRVRALGPDDAPAFVALRREALRDAPLAFASAPEDDRFAREKEVARQITDPRAALFGAFDGERLVGSAGVYLDRHLKAAHKAHVWGVYVAPDRRRRGLARALVEACLARARALGASSARLSVSAAAPEARRLYEALGFQVWGVEPDALRAGGEAADELHMALGLDPAPTAPRILAR